MPRTIYIIVTASLCIAFVLIPLPADDRGLPANPSHEAPTMIRRPWESAADFRVRQTLTAIIPTVGFTEQRFEVVVDDLRKRWGINILPNWAALSASAIERDAEISLRAIDISGDNLLREMLVQISGGESELAYFIEGGAVHITTLEDTSRDQVRCTYDCADLLNVEQSHLQEYLTTVFRAAAAYSGRDIATNSIELERLVRSVFQESRESLRTELAEAIQQSIAPYSWYDNGGNTGSLRFVGDRMIVLQSRVAQNQVFDLLAELRSERPAVAGNGKWP